MVQASGITATTVANRAATQQQPVAGPSRAANAEAGPSGTNRSRRASRVREGSL